MNSMKWFLKVLFYNYFHFYNLKFFTIFRCRWDPPQEKIAHEAAGNLIFGCVFMNLLFLTLFFSDIVTGELVPKFWAIAIVGTILLAGKLIFYNPVLGGDRWKAVLEEEQYASRVCKTVATAFALGSLFVPILAFIFYIEIVNP